MQADYGYALVCAGKLAEASTAFREAAGLRSIAWYLYPTDPETLAGHAPALLLAGQSQEYRRLCSRLLQVHGKSEDERTMYLVARILSLAPDAVDDASSAVKLAAAAVAQAPNTSWYLHTLGLAHYRAGEFDQAVRFLNESTNVVRPRWHANVLNWLALAMAHHRLGNRSEAQRWFDQAANWIDTAAPELVNGGIGPVKGLQSPHDWLSCLLLRGEAESLMNGPRK